MRASDGAPGDAGTLSGWTLTVGHDGAGGSVTGLAGSDSQYLVTVSAAQDGTYNLDLVSSGHGITDSADNPLSSPTPTEADHTYTRPVHSRERSERRKDRACLRQAANPHEDPNWRDGRCCRRRAPVTDGPQMPRNSGMSPPEKRTLEGRSGVCRIKLFHLLTWF